MMKREGTFRCAVIDCLAVLACLAPDLGHATETIQLVTYYNYTPWFFTNAPGRGLNAELARRLSAMSSGRYQFESVFFPRKRLDGLLQQGAKNMVVAWVHPRFFGDMDKIRYLWTGPLMEDESLIVSARTNPVEYDGPGSLRGKRLAAPAGHQFPDLEPLIASGEIVRVEVPQIKNALKMMVLERNLDFTVTDRSTLNALRAEAFMDWSQLYVAKTPRTPLYTRQILVPKNEPELFAFLQQALAILYEDKSWMDLGSYMRPLKVCYEDKEDYPWLIRNDKGLYLILLDMAAQSAKTKVELSSLGGERCLAALAAGEVAAALGFYYSDARAAVAAYPLLHGKPDSSRSVRSDAAVADKPCFLIFGKDYYNRNQDEAEAVWAAIAQVRQSAEYQARVAGFLRSPKRLGGKGP